MPSCLSNVSGTDTIIPWSKLGSFRRGSLLWFHHVLFLIHVLIFNVPSHSCALIVVMSPQRQAVYFFWACYCTFWLRSLPHGAGLVYFMVNLNTIMCTADQFLIILILWYCYTYGSIKIRCYWCRKLLAWITLWLPFINNLIEKQIN